MLAINTVLAENTLTVAEVQCYLYVKKPKIR